MSVPSGFESTATLLLLRLLQPEKSITLMISFSQKKKKKYVECISLENEGTKIFPHSCDCVCERESLEDEIFPSVESHD